MNLQVSHTLTLSLSHTHTHTHTQVDLASGLVSTVTGTGVQGDDKEGGKKGTEQEISSPWDVVLTGQS